MKTTPWIVRVCECHAAQGVGASTEQIARWEVARSRVLKLFDERVRGVQSVQRDRLAEDLYDVHMLEFLSRMADGKLVDWLQNAVDKGVGR